LFLSTVAITPLHVKHVPTGENYVAFQNSAAVLSLKLRWNIKVKLHVV
jgi:hypothetical protein